MESSSSRSTVGGSDRSTLKLTLVPSASSTTKVMVVSLPEPKVRSRMTPSVVEELG